jgi:two-component system, chemotaxis family, protein-glutamate methylesterase/glutaminase
MAAMVSDERVRGVVVVGASAGGVEALRNMAAHLPTDLPYPLLVVLHVPAGAPSVLAQILDRAGPMPAVTAENSAHLEAGQIYVGVPDRHLLVYDHRALLTRGPTENAYRPAINALFRSAASAFGQRAIGVLLSGVLDDGVLGLAAIRARGGTTICQSPDDALFPAMPANARAAGVVDHEVAAAELGTLLKDLAKRDIEEVQMELDPRMELENRIAMGGHSSIELDSEKLGPPSGYTCPDCNGSLAFIGDSHYRCRVGHAWTAEALLHARDDEVEGALWVAVRSLQEKAKLARRMASHVGSGTRSRRYNAQAEEAEHALSVLADRLAGVDPAVGNAADG